MKSISIIGAGKLGKTLGKLFFLNDVFEIKDICCTSIESAEESVNFIGCGVAVNSFDTLNLADIFLISTPDDKIEGVASVISNKFPESIIFHCSGSLSSEIIKTEKRCSIHPVHSFAHPEKSVKIFKDTMCGVEGNKNALEILIPAFKKIGAQIFNIKTDKKPLYHAAAATACNYFVTIEYIAANMFKNCGLNKQEIIQLLMPILSGTLNNIKEKGITDSLTGPISRGDYGVIEKHIEAISKYDESVLQIYKELGLKTLEIAEKQNFASKQNFDEIKKILED